jgi:hypothetical protein
VPGANRLAIGGRCAYTEAMGPWTQKVKILWRPELSFFEQRSSVLRRIEQTGLLPQFRWTVDDVSVRIGQFENVTVGVDGATIHIASPRVGPERTREVLGRFLDAMTPRDVLLRTVQVQSLYEIEDPATEIQAHSGKTLVGDAMPSAIPLDWALLMDGRSNSAPGHFQVEFGVVSRDEAQFRLETAKGRTLGPELPFPPDLEELPESAFYLNWDWTPNVVGVPNPLEEITRAWDTVLSRTDQMSNEVRARFAAGPGRGEAEG